MGEPEEHGYSELVMPFLVVQSQGGEYEDQAFVAGYAGGLLAAKLEHGAVTFTETLRTALLPLADLLSMRHGWQMNGDGWEDDPEWSFVSFSRADPDSVSDSVSAPDTETSSARDVIVSAFRDSGHFEDGWENAQAADAVLKALADAGYTVVRLEQVNGENDSGAET